MKVLWLKSQIQTNNYKIYNRLIYKSQIYFNILTDMEIIRKTFN